MPIVQLTDLADPRLHDYVSLTDVVLRRRVEPERGMYIAEGSTVLGRALAAGHVARSVLCSPRWLPDVEALLASVPDQRDVPVLVADAELVEQVTGYHVHRGALAAMQRPVLPSLAQLLATGRGGGPARRVAVLEDIVDHTNVGAVFRSAAALGVDAVLVSPRCADPLYRRSIRVSMGTVFQVPWTRLELWPGGLGLLRAEGFTVAALALCDESISLDELVTAPPERLALVLGTEGDGLSRGAVDAADLVVRIPMAGGVDSLNVAAASAVAFWATRV